MAIQLAPGVQYDFRQYAERNMSVHTLTMDLSRPELVVEVAKGLENMSGLERVIDIANRLDSVRAGRRTILGGINANFWKAGTNHPMGLTAIDGVILNNLAYNAWPSVVMTGSKSIFIDHFSLDCAISTRFGPIPIQQYNARRDSLSVVVYTSYFGTSVPFIDIDKIWELSKDSISDEGDEEVFFSIVDSLASSKPESGTLKIQFEYLRPPLVNTLTLCRITQVDTGVVMIPKNGGVLSFGKGKFPLFFSLFVGDTFSLSSRLTPVVPEPVIAMSSGTPLLVRGGQILGPESYGNARRSRFIHGKLARSVIGIDKNQKTLILMTVEPPSKTTKQVGATLQDCGRLMVERGAWTAMNFDGGGSATMVVRDSTLTAGGGTRGSRKISTAVFFSKQLPKKERGR